ncbi:MAG: GH116 family glycosyl hydrolase, partial [Opitutales bacterium]
MNQNTSPKTNPETNLETDDRPGVSGEPLSALSRRHFLKAGGMTSALLFTGHIPAMAGPFTGADFAKVVPEDKKLTAAWIRSLFERGTPDWLTGEELKHIGMPVGGICCGQVYLSGDGRLWHWDIFNHDVAPKNRTQGPHYAKPMPIRSDVDIAFSIQVNARGKQVARALDKTGFSDVRFRGAYPMGFVDYKDAAFPVEVSLEAFSPFTPLDVDASSLPLTVMRYTVRNKTKVPLEVALAGTLTNPVLLHSGGNSGADFVNRVSKDKTFHAVHCTADKFNQKRKDMGDMALAILGTDSGSFASAQTSEEGRFAAGPDLSRGPANKRPQGAVGRTLTLDPGAETTISFAVAWRFPYAPSPDPDVKEGGHYYAQRFDSSLAVLTHHGKEHEAAYQRTRLWHDTWYDSTLPYWLLDRVFFNASTLATNTCLRLASGRFWGWEGVGCCPGTCTHVWHYAQTVGRIFPELERITRENVDYGYGLGLQEDGAIFYRAECAKKPKWRKAAVDGQAGTILRVYREHCMSSDSAFLARVWPRVKESIEYLIREDRDNNGVLEGDQHNTLDASWYGPVSWLSSLYLAALRASALMAREMKDEDFAQQCDQLVERGSQWVSDNLFDGEYFYHERDPKHPKALGAGIGCHIDQVFGQGWAHQMDLKRVLPADKTKRALQSLWRYNFTPDVGPYRKAFKGGRWYAMPGEAGLLMCTFPKGGEREARGGKPGGFAGYFNECMTGFEYQVAWHMISEGMVKEGLAVARAIHDRYHPSRRNPYNEVECSDHYARAMASYGVFIALSGFSYHGPKGRIGFAPKMNPENFKAAFTAAEGWGTFTQKRESASQSEQIELRHGSLFLKELTFTVASGAQVKT